MPGPKTQRSFLDSTAILFRWRHLALARWALVVISLCLTLIGDERQIPIEDEIPLFNERSATMFVHQLDPADLYIIPSKSSKGSKGTKMGKHSSSKGGKSKAGKGKIAKSGKAKATKSYALNNHK